MNFNDFINNQYVEKEFDSPIGKIRITRERSIYNELKKWYEQLACSAVNSFIEFYGSYKNCYDILEKAPVDFQKSIAIIIDDIKNTLIQSGQYDWDYATIYEYAAASGCSDEFNERLDAVAEQVISINNDVALQKQYRQQRKDNRGRWQGGTFGGNAINAVSHQMDIAAMNMASGAAHSIANAAGNFMTELQAESDLKALFEDEDVKLLLIEGVYLSSLSMMLVFIKLVGMDYDWGIVDENDSNKAQRLINNLKSGSIHDEDVPGICKEVIALDPYNLEIYEYLFSKYGDDGSLNTLADYFDIEGFANTKDKQALEYVKNNQGETEEDAIKAKELLIEYCKKINLEVNENLECIKYINSIIADFDLKYRTVDDFVCETREGADFSREELPKITEFMKDISPLSSEPLLPYEKNLLAKKEEFENLFSSDVSKKYLDIIKDYLDKFDKEFCRTKLFSSVDRHQAARDRALRYAKGLKYSTIEDYEESYKKLEKFIEPNLGITLDEAIEAKQYLEKKKAKLERGSLIDMDNISNSLNDIGGALKGLFGKRK